MSELETREIRNSIEKGLDRTFKKLLNDKKKTNSELAFVEDNEVVKVKAVDI